MLSLKSTIVPIVVIDKLAQVGHQVRRNLSVAEHGAKSMKN